MSETRLNRFAYKTTGLAVKALSEISRASIRIHGREKIPKNGSIIFAINHFTRLETLVMPYHIHRLTNVPVWSLADYSLFQGGLKKYFDNVGVVSTKNPDRDRLIVKSLLTGEANWIIFPEGRMVKSKKIFEKGLFLITYPGGKHRPHTGAATLALRTEFYRRRLRELSGDSSEEAKRIKTLYEIASDDSTLSGTTYIVPVNLTYYPIRARENVLSDLAEKVEDMPDRIIEEIMTEGTMLISGVDIDIRFGNAIQINGFLDDPAILRDIATKSPIDFDDRIPSRPALRRAALAITQQYMAEIYSMTTINHDHLFASVLKASPFKHISEQDLKNRVFLVSGEIGQSIPHLHSSLSIGQTHLLADDRYGKYKAFLDIALEKGNVAKEGDTLVKDPSTFYSYYDFHNVRVENPVSVIANEVEPLESLRKIIRGFSWQPASVIKKKVAAGLMKKIVSEYEADFNEYAIKGESGDKAIGMPFLIPGKKGREIGVVLIHGYMAAPLEVGSLAAYLGRRGFWVCVPRLKGHGTSPEDLAKRTWPDWRESVDEAYVIIRNTCKKVAVGGFSTGAALALDLAARVGDVDRVFAVCPPRRLQDLSTKITSSVWSRIRKMVSFGDPTNTFIENHPENPHISYARNPVSGIREVELLMESLEPRLPDVKAPSLVVQSHRDPIADYRGSLRIFEMLGSADKKYSLFNCERHCIVLGKGTERVHREIANFLENSLP